MLRGLCVTAIAGRSLIALRSRQSSDGVQATSLLSTFSSLSFCTNDRQLDHRLAQVDAIAPERVRVKVGGPNRGEEGSRYTILVAIKRGGKWIFDPKAAVEAEGTVIVH